MPSIEDKPLEELSQEEIQEALLTPVQPAVNSLDESAEELKAMGIRDIGEADAVEKEVMDEAMKNVQIQRSLADAQRGSSDRRSPRDYLEHHVEFLAKISPGKTKKDIVETMTIEHAAAALKTTAKLELDEALVKKHLKNLKKKYN